MSGGTSALLRSSLCGVVLALAAFTTGCAVDATSDGEDEMGSVEAQADLPVGKSVVLTGAGAPQGTLTDLQLPTSGAQSKSSTSKLEELAEPEPEPWKPDGHGSRTARVILGAHLAGSDDPK
jgi:hypothetical protein